MNMLLRQNDFALHYNADEFQADAAIYKTLLESTRAIPWKIDWATMRFEYIGPQITDLLGWERDSWQTVDDWASRMHPDDRDYVVDFCVSQSQDGMDHEADYRALTKDGGYVWIRDVVHVVRHDNGEVDCLIGFMFDISERKKSEEELVRLQRELEKLSFTDGLTGIANRRMFDQKLASEWSRSCGNGKPLSLILLDIDCFKQFNDAYGHIAGDECLKRVAGALDGVGQRFDELVMRFGGEEFALLLPGADLETAERLAAECAAAIVALDIPHESSSASTVVTASFGVVTARCRAAGNPRTLLETADWLLYDAKAAGRARIESAEM